MTELQNVGIEFIKFLQTFHPQLDLFMGFFALLVKPEIIIVFVIPVLYFNLDQEKFLRLFIVVMIDVAIGEAFRILLAQPRPWWIADLVPIDPVTSIYSSPSGYSSFAIIFCGYLSIHSRKKWLTGLSIFLILATAIAKMYEAATLIDHSILGVIQGAIILYFFIKYENKLFDKLRSLNTIKLIEYTSIIIAGLCLLNLLAFMIHSTYDIPQEWIMYKVIPTQRLSNGGLVFAAGFAWSGLVGYGLIYRDSLNELKKFNIKKKILLTIVGVVGLVIIFIPLRTSLSSLIDSRIVVMLINIIFSFMAGLWFIYFSPKFFVAK